MLANGPTRSDGEDDDGDNDISPVVLSNGGARPGSRGRRGAVRTIFAALEANGDFLDLESYSVAFAKDNTRKALC